MRWFFLCIIVLVFMLVPSWALGQEKIFLKSNPTKPLSGDVKSESPKEVVLGKVMVPAEDIEDIEYQVMPLGEVRLKYYRPALAAEKDASDPKKTSDPKKPQARQELLATAIKNYRETLKKLAPGQKNAARNIEYRVALLELTLAGETGTGMDKALDGLSQFVDKNADGWQITSACHLLGQLLQDAGKFAQAEEVYRKLAEAKVSDKTRQEAQLFEAQAILRSGKHDQALKKLDAFIGKLDGDSPQAMRARVIQGACFLAGKKAADDPDTKKGLDLLRKVVKDAKDSGVKALAYNTMGEWLFASEKYKEARWEFLWVDVVYNQDKNEHSRALYWLWKTFGSLGDLDRANECFETLNERQFNGLPFQQKAQREKQKSKD